MLIAPAKLEAHNSQDDVTDDAAAGTSRPPEKTRITLSCIICTTPRSGSWLLADQLLQTGIAGRPEEYFRLDWYERFLATGEVRYRHMKSHRGLSTADHERGAARSR